jgi:hypothetical protein
MDFDFKLTAVEDSSSSVTPRKEHLELGSHNPLQKIRAVALKILVGALVKRTAWEAGGMG